MAFLLGSIKNTTKAANNKLQQVTNKAPDLYSYNEYGSNDIVSKQYKNESMYYPNIQPDLMLINKNQYNTKLLFKFGGGVKFGYWWIVIYDQQNTLKCSKCYFSQTGLIVKVINNYNHNNNVNWKQHKIVTRSYIEIINFCKKYSKAHPKYNLIDSNSRKFIIRLAEYCNVSINEINKVIIPSSQYYSRNDLIKGTINSTQHGLHPVNLINSNGKSINVIPNSIIKNSAKIVVSTGNTIKDTTNDISNASKHILQ